MDIAFYEYLEVNLIGVVLLFTMLFFSQKSNDREQRCFTGMLVLNALILLSDSGIFVAERFVSPFLSVLNQIFCLSYFLLQLWFCWDWVRYVLQRLYPRYRPGKAMRILLPLPALAAGVFTAASPVTGWVFTVSSDNTYNRGPFLWVPFLVAIIYWVGCSAVILQEWRRPTRSREPGEYGRLLLFPIPILIGNVLQMLFFGLSIVWVCSVISMLVLFIDRQNDQLSRDALTGLYNRRKTDEQLQWEVSRLGSSDDLLFVAMMDVDHFKRINDRFGHPAGDRALAVVAKVLKENTRRSDFVSRFGGDEFLVIGHIKSRADMAGLIGRLKGALAEEAASLCLPYTLTLSVGFAVRGAKDKATLDSVLNDADQRMYEEKRGDKAPAGDADAAER